MANSFLNHLPEQFVRNTVGLCGKKGEQWLKDLPKTIGELEVKWGISVGGHFPNLSYNYVAEAAYNDKSAVLKIGLPLDNVEIFNEAAYLRYLEGDGAVRLLRIDAQRHAILIERAVPGLNLKQCYAGDPKQAIETGIAMLKTIRREPPPQNDFKRLEDWFARLERAERTEFSFEYADKALNNFRQLSAVSPETLIHADLHHENILSSERSGFLVIDPKGIVGYTAYDIAVFLNNHHWWLAHRPDIYHLLKDALAHFTSAFDLDPFDLRKWAFCQMVLSSWWTYEENGATWRIELALADIWNV